MGVKVDDWNTMKLNFRMFSDKKDFIEKGIAANTQNKNLPNYSTTFIRSINKSKDKTLYEYQGILQSKLKQFDSFKDSIDMGGIFKKQKLIITDDKRGIFSFGLASQGLYRVTEYFSKELAIDSPKEFSPLPSGVVPPNLVKTEYGIGNKKIFWYTSKTTDKKYQMKLQQQGTAKILEKDPNAIVKTAQNGLIYAVSDDKSAGKLKFATKNKKSYMMFEKKGGKAKMVELYVPINQGIGLPNIMPSLLIAKMLQEYGIQTRISAIRMCEDRGQYFMWGYPIKDYGDELDFNEIALNCAYVKYNWWELVAGVVTSIYNNENQENSPFKIQGDIPDSYKSYVAAFSRYRNWYMEQIKQGKLPPLRVDKKLMLLGVSNGRTDTDIKNTFFTILDTIDFQFNKPEEACKRVYKRMVEEKLLDYYNKNVSNVDEKTLEKAMKLKKEELTTEFKSYIQNTLIDTYTYPEKGEWIEPQESADKMEEELDEKLKAMNDFLSTV